MQKSTVQETAEYMEFAQEQLYCVLHPAQAPLRARVLLAGTFASERPHRYIPWVRWARFLAARGYEVMRFDYRGIGESTGKFEKFSFLHWIEDVRFCADWLQARRPAVPLILHGLGMGALLAERIFEQGLGDIFLSWLPPKSARDMLYEQLKIKMANNFILPANERRTRDQFVADLEQGKIVEVEGYNWTPQLWADAAQLVFAENSGFATGGRRVRIAGELDALASHTLGGVGPNPLRAPGSGPAMRLVNPDLGDTYAKTVDILNSALADIEAS